MTQVRRAGSEFIVIGGFSNRAMKLRLFTKTGSLAKSWQTALQGRKDDSTPYYEIRDQRL